MKELAERMSVRACSFSVFLALLCGAFDVSAEEKTISGFGAASSRSQRTLEKDLKRLPDVENIRRSHLRLTEDPHVAGTPGGKAVADYVSSEFKRFGIDTSVSEYEVLLSYPRTVELELLSPRQVKLANPEAGYEVDKDSFDPGVDPPWHAYSASGEVRGQVVYANFGNPEDYDRLESLGVSVRDRIVIVRYFKGYRGGKSFEAEKRKVKALIIYSDPAEDGYVRGDAYPRGPWGPESHVQRGANVYDFKVPGDPLTPGWASVPGARRIDEGESEILPKIMTIPISYADAIPILENLAGPPVPAGWQGGLPFTYHVGPGPAVVRLELDITRERRKIFDIIGRIEGRLEPEKMVILGNHHDAWVYGGVDPSSGTAALLELARVFGELQKSGWRPNRTIVLGCWDAEEYTLTGSTEWGEEHAENLRRNAVACLNVDAAASGGLFSATAVPSLREFIVEATRDMEDPAGGKSVYDKWAASTEGTSVRSYGGTVDTGRPVNIGILGSGSDYTVFFNFLGVPSVDMLFDGPYGVYHSQYDNHQWMRWFGDPGFLYHRTMVTLWGMMATRLANAEILPFDYEEYGHDLRLYTEGLSEVPTGSLDVAPLLNRVDRFIAAASQARTKLAKLHSEEAASPALLRRINEALMKVERDLTTPEGIPGRPWFKHLIYAPLPTYQAETFPGIREALLDSDSERAKRQSELLIEALGRAIQTLESIPGT